MKYYIISGEASGDLHASNLAKYLFENDSQAKIRAWGGDLLRKQGAEVVKDYKDLAFMGFVEVALNLKTILGNLRFCKKDILNYQPDVVILVDYPGFNLRMAKFLHENGIKVFYYISPQVWAWHKSRVKIIKKYVNELFVILPFEKDFYAKHDFSVHYLGHPLLDVVEESKKNRSTSSIADDLGLQKPIIAILPGSRKQEILRMLPTMLQTSKQLTNYDFVIAGVENHRNLYASLCKDYDVQLIYNQTYSLLSSSYAAMVTSGTATLETALFNVPQVVCYKGNFVSYLIAKHLIKDIQYISLVNLIADKKVVTELIQREMNTDRLFQEMQLILGETKNRQQLLADYALIHQNLGNGNASQQIAEKMRELVC
jgi:lipid-A-disaccharide synthase